MMHMGQSEGKLQLYSRSKSYLLNLNLLTAASTLGVSLSTFKRFVF